MPDMPGGIGGSDTDGTAGTRGAGGGVIVDLGALATDPSSDRTVSAALGVATGVTLMPEFFSLVKRGGGYLKKRREKTLAVVFSLIRVDGERKETRGDATV
jgi:hypothetical protein